VRIGFLFNHDALHQVRHTAPVIAEMTRRPGVETVVLTSSQAQEDEVRALIGEAATKVRFGRLDPGPVAAFLDSVLRFVAPFRRVAVLKRNLPVFAALDVLVVPETTSLLLRDRLGLSDLGFVWIPHGAGDRSVGFRPVMRGFNLVLLSGEKVYRRMLEMGLITPQNSRIVGYPKFDSVDPRAPGPSLFDNGRPTVVYNPHFEPLLSSWYVMGTDVLDWFADQDRFNLIFAPHVMLFNRRIHASVEHRRIRWRADLPERYRGLAHMLIDTGSARSTDMTYTRSADIYIGDVSSQIYEWIGRPRPAIFLNASGAQWQGNADFAHWELGEVIASVDALPGALDRAVANPNAWHAKQEAAFNATFSVEKESASHRAASAILQFFSNEPASA
jgi:hypothetical protein